MTDKDMMEELLLLEKGVCDLYLHGTLEAATGNVQRSFGCALEQSLMMQSNIYSKMQEKGWYTVQNVPQQQLGAVKQKFSAQ